MTTVSAPLLSSARRRPRFRLLATIRVLALLGMMSLISLWALLRATQASAADVLVQLGNQLMLLPDAHYGSGVRQLWINGLSLNLQSGWSEKDPIAVSAQFRAACAARSAMQLDAAESAKVAPLSAEVKLKLAEVICVGVVGPPVTVVSGATVSSVHV